MLIFFGDRKREKTSQRGTKASPGRQASGWEQGSVTRTGTERGVSFFGANLHLRSVDRTRRCIESSVNVKFKREPVASGREASERKRHIGIRIH